jgi:hypothetical protein
MQTDQPKLSRYLQAGSPICCYSPTCQKPFLGTCVHANDGHFYCSHACADDGERDRPSAKVEQFRARKR